jgi:hypothetical protein
MAFGISKLYSVSNLFVFSLSGFDRNIIFLGTPTTCWSLWLHRNAIVFEKKNNYSPLHAIYSIAHWLPTCAILQKTELRSMVVKAKQYLL